jgi:Zn-dependent metalloprotease
MPAHPTHRHSIFCILPPHVLRNVAMHGNPAQRTAALNTLASDLTFRTMRATTPQAHAAIASDVSAGTPVVNRTIDNANHTQQLPGTQMRAEGGPATGDVEADEAYDGLGATFNFYLAAYHRNSIDNQGLPLLASVHYGVQYDNAFWNGQQMVFGDGDGQLFERFTIAVDVIGHELTHGVTGSEVNLTYIGQSGALNESVSDVFGSMVKQYKLGQTAAQADWLIGAGLLMPSVHGVALRSMKAPGTAYDDPVLGKDPQPATMAGYVHTTQDNGGVHTNSGIPNHAFYLAAAAIGGYAWEKAGNIWYETIGDPKLKRTANFRSFAARTVANAQRLYGATGAEQAAVTTAWQQVGVLP